MLPTKGWLALGMALLGSASWAQSPPVTPPPKPPGNGLPSREQIEPVAPDRAALPPIVVQINKGRVERGPCPFDQSDAKVAISSIRYVTATGAPVSPSLLLQLQDITPAQG